MHTCTRNYGVPAREPHRACAAIGPAKSARSRKSPASAAKAAAVASTEPAAVTTTAHRVAAPATAAMSATPTTTVLGEGRGTCDQQGRKRADGPEGGLIG